MCVQSLARTVLLTGLIWPALLLAQNGPVQPGIPFPEPTERRETGISVFIDFAKEHYGSRFEEKMLLKADSPQWSKRIARYAKHWSADDARIFLQLMVDKIGVSETLKKLKRASYFRYMDYAVFTNSTEILQAWASERATWDKIEKSLSGFQNKLKEEVAVELLEFFRTVKWSTEEIAENLGRDLRHHGVDNAEELTSLFREVFEKRGRLEGLERESFMHTLRDRLLSAQSQKDQAALIALAEDYLDMMDDYLRAQEIVRDMMLRNLADFALIELRPFYQVVNTLRKRNIPEVQIVELFKNNVKGAAVARSGRIVKNAEGLALLFFSAEERQILNVGEVINRMILKNITEFNSIDLDELKEAMEWAQEERGIPLARVKRAFRGSIEGMAKVRKKRLDNISQHIQAFFARSGIENPQEAANEMMLKNIGAFSQIYLHHFDEVAMYLKSRGISQRKVAEALMGNVEAAATLRKEHLKFMIEYMEVFFGGGEKAQTIVETILLKNPSNLFKIDIAEFEELVAFLKDKRGFSKAKIRDIFSAEKAENMRVRVRNLKRGIGALEIFFADNKNVHQIVNHMIVEDMAGVASIVPGEFEKTVAFLRGRGLPYALVENLVQSEIMAVGRIHVEGRFRSLVERMDAFFGKEIVNQMMLKNFDVFANVDLQEFDLLVAFLEKRHIPEKSIKKALSGNVRGLAVQYAHLMDNAREMEEFFTTVLDLTPKKAAEMANHMMMKNLSGFAAINMREFKRVMAFLLEERSVSVEQVIELCQKNVLGTVQARKEQLESMAKRVDAFFATLMSEEEARAITNQMMLQNLAEFPNVGLDKFYRLTGVYRGQGIPNAQIGNSFKRNIKKLATIDEQQLEQATARIHIFLNSVLNEILLENPASFAHFEEALKSDLDEKRAACRDNILKIMATSPN